MGYTHYWNQHEEFSDEEWESLIEFTSKLLSENSIIVEEHFIVDSDEIVFNGLPSCETFVLKKESGENPEWLSNYYEKSDGVFNFCKTRNLPYDRLVVKVLRKAYSIAPEVLTLQSDGDVFEDL